MTRKSGDQRYCAGCGVRLSRYNAESFCSPCGLAARDEWREPPNVPRPFWQTDQMRDALGTWHMGRVMVAYRTHPYHGKQLPQERIAAWLNLTQGQLSRVENGSAPEQLGKLVAWARVLGIPDDLLWFKLPGHSGDRVHVNTSTLGRWLVADGHGPPPPFTDADELERVRRALTDAHRYFDGSTVDFFRQQLAQCKTDDGSLGPAKALPLVLGILTAIRQSAKDVRPDVRRSLLAVGADSAEFAGWLYRDLRDPLAATFLYDRAMEWAQQAMSLPMQGYILLKKSQMAYETKDADTLLDLAQAAKGGHWQLPARIRAEVVQQEALGLAMTGERIGCIEQSLGEAERLLMQANGDEDQLLGAYFTESTLMLRAACCYSEAGVPEKAIPLFGDALASGALSKRDSGFFGARQAKALAISGEPDEAATVAAASVAVARETRSERTMNIVVEVVHALDAWRNRPKVRELKEVLLP